MKKILSELGQHYTIEAEISPKFKDFEPDDNCRVAYVEVCDDMYVICVSQLQ